MSSKSERKELSGFYGFVERAGNKIPHPVFLFIWLLGIALVVSCLLGNLGVSVKNPTTGEEIVAVNILTASGIGNFLRYMGSKWMNFAPMITVPICTLGLAVANRSGLLQSCLKLAGATKSVWKLTLIVAFIGVNANLVGDAAFIIFPPLVAMLFTSVNRNPIAGLFLAFATVSTGFGANLLVGSADASLAGLTEAAAKIIDKDFEANPAMGWYFLFVSTFLVTFLCSWICIKYIEPRIASEGLGEATMNKKSIDESFTLTDIQKKGARNALITLVLFFVITALLCIDGMPFAAPEGGSIMTGLLFKCVPTLIFIMFFATGYAYGKTVGTIKKFSDTIPMMQEELKTLASFFLICFFAAQFIAVFSDSNVATIIAVLGGQFLSSLGLPRAALLGAFVILIGFINLFMGSANGKWALISTMFVPMFMIAGINPSAAQVAYRMGDGLTNNICPCIPYLAIILGYAQEYDARAKTGTVVAYMLPYTFIVGAVWIIFLTIWVMLGLPMGPGYPALIG